jgi:hypothetical protein
VYLETFFNAYEGGFLDPPVDVQSIGEYVYSSAGGGCWIWEPSP